MANITLEFDSGTLVLDGLNDPAAGQLPSVTWDQRTQQWRAPGRAYRQIVTRCKELGHVLVDNARAYETLNLTLAEPIIPREHQTHALREWSSAGKAGCVALPTGAGKTNYGSSGNSHDRQVYSGGGAYDRSDAAMGTGS